MKQKDYTDWEKIFSNNVMNKSLILKWLIQLSIIKKQPNQKKGGGGRRPKQTFFPKKRYRWPIGT